VPPFEEPPPTPLSPPVPEPLVLEPLVLELVFELFVPEPPALEPPVPLELGVQAPALQVPPGHAVPSAACGFEHVPDVGSHVPAVWHASIAMHATGLAPMHAPPMHLSMCVHALPSSQVTPSILAGFEHIPVVGSHIPMSWH
jgi:hypothetical protein